MFVATAIAGRVKPRYHVRKFLIYANDYRYETFWIDRRWYVIILLNLPRGIATYSGVHGEVC